MFFKRLFNNEFTSKRELKKQYKAVPERKKMYKGKGGIPLFRSGEKIYIDDSSTNSLIIGNDASGVTQRIMFPTIDIYSRAEEKSSMVIVDPGGELVESSYDTLEKRGYEVQILNLIDPSNSMNYNPLEVIIEAYKKHDDVGARSLCNTITYPLYNNPTAKDKFWQTSAQLLVNSIILALTYDFIESEEEEKITMYTVANFLAEYGGREDEEGNNLLDKFFKERPYDVAKIEYEDSNFSKENVRESILLEAMKGLEMFKLLSISFEKSYELSNIGFGDNPVALFIVTSNYGFNTSLASIFIRQLNYILTEKASLSEEEKCKREVVFLIDDFGSIPSIENFSNIILHSRKRNIKFILRICSSYQLNILYEKDKINIISNCGNIIYLNSNDLDTAKYISELVKILTPSELMIFQNESLVIRHGTKLKPIFNTLGSTLKCKYEYLEDDFVVNDNILNLGIDA